MEATFNPLTITEAQWAYLAGLFDGEGTVTVSYPNKRAKPSVRLRIGMTDEDTIRWVHGMFGGLVHRKKVQGTMRLPAWEWTAVRKADVSVIAQGIMPYCITKRGRLLAASAVVAGDSELLAECFADPDRARQTHQLA